MENETRKMLFEIAKSQDSLMHTASSELGVRTSLYLVFAVFLFNAAFQVSTFARGVDSVWATRAVITSTFGAGAALAGGVALMIAALTRTYSVVPIQGLQKYVLELAEYKQQNPTENLPDTEDEIIASLEETTAANLEVNEKKGFWNTLGATALFIAVPFVVGGGILAFVAYVR